MIVRLAQSGDVKELERIHAATGVDYKFPELGELVLVLEEDGQVIGGGTARVVAETYLWIDPALNPRDKWTAIRLLQKRGMEEAHNRGWSELIAMIPRCVEKVFRKRLEMLRWRRTRAAWRLWYLEIPEEVELSVQE